MRKNCKVWGSLNRSSHHRMSCLKGTKFIRTVNKSCATKIRLPSRFGRNVAEFLGDGALLYVNGVDVRDVEVVQSNGGCSLAKGWSKLFEAYKVGKGYVLMFKYMGYSGFKVEIFNGRTGVVVDQPISRGSSAGDGEAAGEGQAEEKKVGRPRVVYQESEEVGHLKLHGMKLRKFAIYNLRAKLRRRKLPENGCKGELVERLGRYIMGRKLRRV